MTPEEFEELKVKLRTGKYIMVGKPGSGKGAAYAWFPKPHFVADTDGKIENLKFLYRNKIKTRAIGSYQDFDKDDLDYIQYIRYPGPKSYDAMYVDFRQAINDPPVRADGTPGTWTLDSLTTLAGNTINYCLMQRADLGKATGRIQIPDLPEWLGESMFLSSLFIDAKDLPCNVILTGHWNVVERDVMATREERKTGTPSSRLKVTKQMMTGGTKIGVAIPGYFNEIYNTQLIPPYSHGDPETFKIFTGATEEVEVGRSRLHPELQYEIDMTYDRSFPDNIPNLYAHIEEATKKIIETMEVEVLHQPLT